MPARWAEWDKACPDDDGNIFDFTCAMGVREITKSVARRNERLRAFTKARLMFNVLMKIFVKYIFMQNSKLQLNNIIVHFSALRRNEIRPGVSHSPRRQMIEAHCTKWHYQSEKSGLEVIMEICTRHKHPLFTSLKSKWGRSLFEAQFELQLFLAVVIRASSLLIQKKKNEINGLVWLHVVYSILSVNGKKRVL